MNIRGRKKKKEAAAAASQGLRLLAERKHEEACSFLRGEVQRFPEEPDIRMHYAHSLLAIRPDDAAPEIIKAIEMDPDEPVRLTRAAGILFKIGDVERARSYTTRAKELAPPNFLFKAYLLNLDSHFAALEGQDKSAEEGFRLAMEQEPDGETFAVDLAQFLADRDRLPEALSVIDEALPQAKRREPLERLRGELLAGSEPD